MKQKYCLFYNITPTKTPWILVDPHKYFFNIKELKKFVEKNKVRTENKKDKYGILLERIVGKMSDFHYIDFGKKELYVYTYVGTNQVRFSHLLI